MSSLELTKIIVGGDYNPKYLCKVKPVSVQHNAVFIVDLKQVELRDLGASDNGAWEIMRRSNSNFNIPPTPGI